LAGPLVFCLALGAFLLLVSIHDSDVMGPMKSILPWIYLYSLIALTSPTVVSPIQVLRHVFIDTLDILLCILLVCGISVIHKFLFLIIYVY
jgi:hypothetical protein